MNLLKKLVGAASNLEHAVGGAIASADKPVEKAAFPVATAVFGNKGNSPQKQPFNVAPMQKINLTEGAGINSQLVPTIPAYQGNQVRLNAQKQLGLTPAFVQNLINAQPYVGAMGKTGDLKNPSSAGAEFTGNARPNQIVLSPGAYGALPSTILHEGLHRVYAANPQAKTQFNAAYNKSATPNIKGYVGYRLNPYSGATKGIDEGGVPIPNYNPNNINTMAPELQNEAHSYTSQVPTMGVGLPKALNDYYAKYFNTKKAVSYGKNNLNKLMIANQVSQAISAPDSRTLGGEY